MPYKSQKQRAYMHIHLPDIAKKWDAETVGKPKPKKAKKAAKGQMAGQYLTTRTRKAR